MEGVDLPRMGSRRASLNVRDLLSSREVQGRLPLPKLFAEAQVPIRFIRADASASIRTHLSLTGQSPLNLPESLSREFLMHAGGSSLFCWVRFRGTKAASMGLTISNAGSRPLKRR